jgi:hypothetical protein
MRGHGAVSAIRALFPPAGDRYTQPVDERPATLRAETSSGRLCERDSAKKNGCATACRLVWPRVVNLGSSCPHEAKLMPYGYRMWSRCPHSSWTLRERVSGNDWDSNKTTGSRVIRPHHPPFGKRMAQSWWCVVKSRKGTLLSHDFQELVMGLECRERLYDLTLLHTLRSRWSLAASRFLHARSKLAGHIS